MTSHPRSARAVVRWVTALVVLLCILVGALLAVTAVQIASTQNELEDELNPARVELSTLLALYVDQETAERGYILTGRPTFLEPYDAAGPEIERILALLGTQVSPEVRPRADRHDRGAPDLADASPWSRSWPPYAKATGARPPAWWRPVGARSSSTRCAPPMRRPTTRSPPSSLPPPSAQTPCCGGCRCCWP